MFELSGKYNTAKIFADNIDNDSISQIIQFLNQPIAKNQTIRLMPDVHAGSNCVIGTTMTITDKAVPNLVGSDIGCGMETVYLDADEIDFNRIDEIIRKYVPYGYDIREKPHQFIKKTKLTEMNCYFKLEAGSQGDFALGTLGGGNHFIEIGKDKDENFVMVVHTGSRRIGADVCEYYQNQALKMFKRMHSTASNKDLIYCEGKLFEDYIHDMKIMQEFASWNRKAIIETILTHYGMDYTDSFTTIHNYIDTAHNQMILRKGAVSAYNGEKLLIPINMREGSLICRGKGNKDWNCSAPHGAGRLMSRREAKEKISLEEYETTMKGIFTTSVNQSTIDESPMAYKPIESIVNNIQDTVEIIDVIKPVYNFKA